MAASRLRVLVQSTALYGLSNALVSGSKFFLIPLYAHFISAEQYGLLGISNTIGTLLVLTSCMGINRAVTRDYFEYRHSPGLLRAFLVTMAGFLAKLNAWLLGGTLIAGLLLGGAVEAAIHLPFFPYVMVYSAIATATAFYSAGMAVLQAEERPAAYVAGQLARFLVSVFVTVPLIVYWKMGAMGVLWGELAGTGLCAAVILGLRWRELLSAAKEPLLDTLPSPERMRKAALAYGLPFVVSDLCAWFMVGLDRMLIAGMRPMSEVGIYTVALSMAQGLRVIITAINQAYMPFFLKTAQEGGEGSARVFGRAMEAYALALGAVCVAGMLFSKEIIMLVAPSEYHEASGVMSLLLGAAYLTGLYNMLVMPILHMKLTRNIPLMMLVAGGINVMLILMLLPRLGIIGAGLSSIISWAVLVAMGYAVAQRLYRIRYNLPLLALTVFAVLATGLALGQSTLAVRVVASAAFSVAGAWGIWEINRGRLRLARKGGP